MITKMLEARPADRVVRPVVLVADWVQSLKTHDEGEVTVHANEFDLSLKR